MREVKKASTIIKNYEPMAVRCVGGPEEGFSVLVKDKKSQFVAWFDVWVDNQFRDIRCEWNQFIFFLTDARDCLNKHVMDDCDVFSLTDSCAVEYLFDKGFLKQDEKANWSYTGKSYYGKES